MTIRTRLARMTRAERYAHYCARAAYYERQGKRKAARVYRLLAAHELAKLGKTAS
jgi:hypothetical protein